MAIGAGAAEGARSLTANASPWAQHLSSLGIGALAGGHTGAATAGLGEQYNRQLHPNELQTITAHADAFAKDAYGCERSCTDAQIIAARNRLIITAARTVDARWDRTFRDLAVAKDPAADAFLNTLRTSTHPDYTDFSANWHERHDHRRFADRLHKSAAKDALYVAVLNQARTAQQQRSLLITLNNTAPQWLDDHVDRQARWRLQALAGNWLDAAPVIGDYRAFRDAQTVSDYTWASVGVMTPIVGKAVTTGVSAIKGARNAPGTALNAADGGAGKAAGQTTVVDSKGNALVGGWSSTKKLTSPRNALKHWNDHKSEFPEFSNASQYIAAAQNFVTNPPLSVLTKARNGDTLLYDPGSNVFAVRSADGVPRTMFRPNPSMHGYATNMDYFNAQ